ncbi:MAG: DNA polymerase III subunit delta [Planctomycetes bacterium]|nr:DNA polymerase III subunit delta [Planctomycetota bacterium]
MTAREAAGPALPAALPPVIALVGDEERAKERLLAQILERAGREASVISLAAEGAERADLELPRLLADLASRPLFGGLKVIVARDGDALWKRHGKALEAALKIAAGNHLVLLMRSLDLRVRFANELKKSGGLIKCPRPRADAAAFDGQGALPAASELLQAVLAEARAHGLNLAPRAAAELAGRTGNDLMLVAREMEKLSLYLAGRSEVTLEHIAALVPRSAAWDQFQLFQEVAVGDTRAALLRLCGMLREGTTDRGGRRVNDARGIASGLAALLHQRIRLLARYRSLKAARCPEEEVQRRLAIRNPGQLYYLGKEVELPLVRRAHAAVRVLAEADRALKSSEPPETLLEPLIVRLCALAAQERARARRGARS